MTRGSFNNSLHVVREHRAILYLLKHSSTPSAKREKQKSNSLFFAFHSEIENALLRPPVSLLPSYDLVRPQRRTAAPSRSSTPNNNLSRTLANFITSSSFPHISCSPSHCAGRIRRQTTMISPSSTRTYTRVAFLLLVVLISSLLTSRYKLAAPYDRPYGSPINLGHQAWEVSFAKQGSQLATVGSSNAVNATEGNEEEYWEEDADELDEW
jgi:hypothetical protein